MAPGQVHTFMACPAPMSSWTVQLVSIKRRHRGEKDEEEEEKHEEVEKEEEEKVHEGTRGQMLIVVMYFSLDILAWKTD